ncbi:alpha/beta hydrolase family esterase [Thalassotalea euphylliae]|uniref:alpha/beta hydrolase family esterase n=1 Tax=Thalassotalea euphylliae TaxID=1655234 RepID=UPI0036329352
MKNILNQRAIYSVIYSLLIAGLSACGGGGSSNSSGTSKKSPQQDTATCTGAQISNVFSCITIDERESISYIPTTVNEDTRIALFLHGAPGSANKVMNIFDAKAIADKHNFIVLAPEGNKSLYEWDSQNIPADNANKDIDYILALIDQVQAENSQINTDLFVFGYSAGGFMAYKLACKIPERISGIVSLAGQYRGDLEACSTATPVSIHHLHSPVDADVPYNGRSNGNIASVDDTIALWKVKNGCSDLFTQSTGPGMTEGSDRTEHNTYDGCTHSLTLSIMSGVQHEADYQASQLMATYEYMFE